jgi:hypothetical protein
VPDILVERSETAILTISADPKYQTGAPNAATVSIANN